MLRTLNRLKVGLVRAFHWDLNTIAQTDVYALFAFLEAYMAESGSGPKQELAYADEVDWL
jgi:hypothetical protein